MMPFAFLLTVITSNMASDRGSRTTAQTRKADLQYRVPLTAQTKQKALQKIAPAAPASPAATEIIWTDDFEQGTNGWTVESAFKSYWYLSRRGVFGNSGFSYWCADSNLNGYDDDWLQLLVSPEIDLSGTTAPMLTFKHWYTVENPAGASQSIPQVDGWDGMNVRISTDGGNTFVPIRPVGDYPHRSLFGFYRSYGFNIPGWAGKSNDWVDATFDLKAYIGRKIIMRFEFGSDPACSTEDSATCSLSDIGTLRGWRIDNVKISDGTTTIFSDDGGDTGAASLTPALPNTDLYWHMVTTRSTSQTHSWWCGDDATGRYSNNVSNYLISPKIYIPSTGQLGGQWVQIYLDFQLFYSMEFTDLKIDFFRVWVSNNGGKSWQNPVGSRFVGNSGNDWIPFYGSYSDDNNNILVYEVTDMAGDSVQFRWEFSSDFSVNDIGLFIDDPALVGISGLPNDVSTIDLDVAYPNIAGQPIKTFVEVINVGINNQATIPLWYQINTDTQRPVPPLFPLNSGASTVREFEWTALAAGEYHLTVFTNLPNDEARSNDTLSTRLIAPIQVTSPGTAILGYEDRYNPTFVSLVSRIVHFTPKSDVNGLSTYDLQLVGIVFANQGDQADQLRVRIGTAATSTTFANVLLDTQESIPVGDLSFHIFDLSANAGAGNLTGDFLVEIDYAGSNGNGTVLLDGGTRFSGHNYFFNPQAQAYQPSDLGAFVNSRIVYLTTAVEERAEAGLPQQFNLYASYPNPVRSAHALAAKDALDSDTRISFDLPKTSHVKITVYDITGRLIATVLNERRPAGRHEVRWNVRGLPAGTYFYKMQAEKFEAVRKMLIL
jgi:hypothetical protein